ncbi:kinase-like protein [Fomitiporia mediterranea MF3/22]|uniref:kinase-like protein n=1 Tax=Fomitiporia mediterranea (strain MF3/22) TaxID=694068 RepID=UPI0004409B65|nr:kinase-like protein [Fomitiporia mediterranea MF3/22]EJD05054.1 kinase-like protein [Fomitiporia mediterranea MF3/22]
MVDWLVDTPSPQYELHNKPIRDSGTLYNYLGERSPRPHLHPDAATESPRRPSLQINGISTLNVGGDAAQKQLVQHLSPASAGPSSSSSSSASTSASATPSPSPLQRYRGWVSEVVAPLEEFIDHSFDPRELFTDLQEIAEGESGSVFSASIVPSPPSKSKLKSSTAHISKNESGKVAIKQVPLLPGGSPKLEEMRKELMLMSRVSHEHILSMDALFVDLVEDALWIEMELMERSLADVLGLVEEGLVLEERVFARFATDILSALVHLETLGIVHRDVRSDNLLVNSQGVLKLADFSNALLVDPAYPTYKEPAGVIYWQAPEMRSSPYDAQKVDIWSAGATVWEMAEAEPPFMHIEVDDIKDLPERWPMLSKATEFSRSFHDFLNLCSNPPSERPSAHDLLTTPFILSACDRSFIMDLLSQCKAIEERIHRRTSTDSEGTVLS